MVLVDTTIWSLALRHRPDRLHPREQTLVDAWASLVASGTALLIGPIRQEILSGIRHGEAFEAIRRRLAAFPYLPIGMQDYDKAAVFFNTCRAKGITGSATDMLICAAADGHGVPIFTTDPDYQRYARHVPVRLYKPGKKWA